MTAAADVHEDMQQRAMSNNQTEELNYDSAIERILDNQTVLDTQLDLCPQLCSNVVVTTESHDVLPGLAATETATSFTGSNR